MKFLNFVMHSVMLFATTLVLGEDTNFDHERLTTTDGKVFLEIFVIGSDATGLTFRHREGIAKVDFPRLSDAYRMLYEGLEAVEDETNASREGGGMEAPADGAGVDDLDSEEALLGRPEDGPVNLEARSRVVMALPAPLWWLGGGVDHDVRVPAWPSWWPRHEKVHRLTHPLFRELAVRDFLHSSGLLPCYGAW